MNIGLSFVLGTVCFKKMNHMVLSSSDTTSPSTHIRQALVTICKQCSQLHVTSPEKM